jgi:2,4-dienoyl-CoA reductase-like NADH-dependent reductase (Old Yellow Enzyme family)
MRNIFEPLDLAGIKLNNRVLRAATDEGMADTDGNPTEKLIKLYENLAKGGVGGIITGYMAVSKDGESTMPGMVMMDSDDRIEALTEVVNRVHKAGTPIIAQLAHCGRNGVGGKAFKVNKVSEDTMEQIINDFIDAVIRAKKIGYDGVELHLAHGYFLSEMLSGHTNRRKDKWGGSIQNRTQIVKEIMEGIRKTLPDYPVLAKVNGDEIYKDGIHSEEAAEIAKLLESYGVSAIEVSCGIDTKQMGPLKGEIPVDMVMQKYPGIKDLPKPIKSMVKPLLPTIMKEVKSEKKYNVPSAKKINKAVTIPVIALGGIHDLEDIESTINQDGIDFVSMSRPLILEPGLINKYKEQKEKNAKCLGCNYCMIGICNDPLRCYYGKLPK